jgi:predicted amidophosphoribosyltransferase
VITVLPQATKLKRVALDLLFPRYCVGCGREGSFIYSACRKSLSRITPPICPRCGLHQASGLLCPQCVGGRAEIDRIRSPFQFTGVMRQAIHQLKYQNLWALAAPLASLLGDYFNDNYLPADGLVPVPLHPRRMRERGYNQSALLAGELAKLINLPVEDCLTRREYRPPQARTATIEERRANVSGAFTCRGQWLRDKHVLLIDEPPPGPPWMPVPPP